VRELPQRTVNHLKATKRKVRRASPILWWADGLRPQIADVEA
jgi:hypothetical protein